MCVLSIKMPIRNKSGNLFNDPRKYSLSRTSVPIEKVQNSLWNLTLEIFSECLNTMNNLGRNMIVAYC